MVSIMENTMGDYDDMNNYCYLIPLYGGLHYKF